MESTNVYDLRDFAEVSARLEKNDGSNTGKGFVTYFKDGEMYEMEVIYVDGRKEGKGILRDKARNIIGTYFFRNDELCVFDAVDKTDKNKHSNLKKPSRIRFSPVKSDANLWTRIKQFLIFLAASYVIYEGLYFLMISFYINDNTEVTISSCETVRHLNSERNKDVSRLNLYLNNLCESNQDDPFLLQKFVRCNELSLFHGDQFTELKIENANYLRILSIHDYHSVKDIYISGLHILEYLHIYPNSLSSAKTMGLNSFMLLENLVIDEGALSSLEHLSLSFQGELCSIRMRTNSLQSLTSLSIQSPYYPKSIYIGQGALSSLKSLPDNFFNIKEIEIHYALQSIEKIDARGCHASTITIYSEMESMTSFKIQWSDYVNTITIGDNALQNVKTFSLKHLNVLTNLNINDNSLNSAETFELVYLPKLKELVIPKNCLNSVKTFNIQQLTSLRTIIVGESSLQSLTKLVLEKNEYPYLRNFECDKYSFSSVSYLEIANFASLQTLVFKENSFTESFDQEPIIKHNKSASIFNCTSLQSIVLEEFVMSEFTEFNIHTLPKLGTLKTGGLSFFNIDRFIIRGNQIILPMYSN